MLSRRVTFALAFLLLASACKKNDDPELGILPKACFTASDPHDAPWDFLTTWKTITFTSCSYIAKKFEWDFGDGARSDKENPVHEYSYAGDYTVRLTVETDGKVDTFVKDVQVWGPDGGCAALFFINTSSAGDSTSFIYQSSKLDQIRWSYRGQISPYEWSLFRYDPNGRVSLIEHYESKDAEHMSVAWMLNYDSNNLPSPVSIYVPKVNGVDTAARIYYTHDRYSRLIKIELVDAHLAEAHQEIRYEYKADG